MPTPIPDDKRAELSDLIFRGRKIEAIKLHRELTSLGLKEAKDEVEALEATLRKQSPEKFTAPKAKGCFGAAAVLCLLVVAGGSAALFTLSKPKTPLEIVRLSEALVIAKIQSYHRQPDAASLRAVTAAIANHRKAIERAALPQNLRDQINRNLEEQIWIVRGIATTITSSSSRETPVRPPP